MRGLRWFVMTLVMAFAWCPVVRAAGGVQITPDGKRSLISKDVGAERWAITANPDGTVTGNVFFPDGGPPQFVWCEEKGRSSTDVSLSCWGADACAMSPCDPDQWVFLADVELPISFFLPPPGDSSDDGDLPGDPGCVDLSGTWSGEVTIAGEATLTPPGSTVPFDQTTEESVDFEQQGCTVSVGGVSVGSLDGQSITVSGSFADVEIEGGQCATVDVQATLTGDVTGDGSTLTVSGPFRAEGACTVNGRAVTIVVEGTETATLNRS